MKAETKLNKIMQLEDGNLKLMKLFSFSCNRNYVLNGSKLWQVAQDEFNRLWELGYRMTK